MAPKKPRKGKLKLDIYGTGEIIEKNQSSKINGKSGTPAFMKIFFVIILSFMLMLGSGFFSPNTGLNPSTEDQTPQSYGTNEGPTIFGMLISSPSCGCCMDYVDILNDNGFEITQNKTDDYMDVKDKYDIPEDHRSCHTMIIGDYFVEGHVPISSIVKMINNEPDIDGISLSGMPAGSPGMGAEKTEVWEIYAINNGVATSIFDTI